MSLGQLPYGNLAGGEVFRRVNSGERLQQPFGCPKRVYTDLMLQYLASVSCFLYLSLCIQGEHKVFTLFEMSKKIKNFQKQYAFTLKYASIRKVLFCDFQIFSDRQKNCKKKKFTKVFEFLSQNIGVACSNFGAVRIMNGRFVTVNNFVAKN
jgi:hypothetical protein